MAELESYRLVIFGTSRRLKLKKDFLQFYWQELNWHVTVKRLDVRPALDAVLCRKTPVDGQECIQLEEFHVPILKSALVYPALQRSKYSIPFSLPRRREKEPRRSE